MKLKKLFKNQIKIIKSLDSKKGRKVHNLFVLESKKAVLELVGSKIDIQYLVFDSLFDNEERKYIMGLLDNPEAFETDEFYKISSLKNSEGVLVVARIPNTKSIDYFFRDKDSIVGLFDINDPGNLGTIFRTALWYGVDGLILFGNAIDIYSPKVIRSSMGAILKLDIITVERYSDIANNIAKFKVVGTFLDKKHNFKNENSDKIMLMFGNEANGLDCELKDKIDYNFRINGKTDFESLNVSIAAGIIMDRIFNSED